MRRFFITIALLATFAAPAVAGATEPVRIGVHEVSIERGKTGSSVQLLRLLPTFDKAFPGSAISLLGSTNLTVPSNASRAVGTHFGKWQLTYLGESGDYCKLSLKKVGSPEPLITFRVQPGSTFFVATDRTSDVQRGLAVHVHPQ